MIQYNWCNYSLVKIQFYSVIGMELHYLFRATLSIAEANPIITASILHTDFVIIFLMRIDQQGLKCFLTTTEIITGQLLKLARQAPLKQS